MNKRRTLIVAAAAILSSLTAFAESAEVSINLNMKHSVDGESRFGRERRMTIHATHHETDWDGHEDMLDYLINDLDVYFGRETGGATWKMQLVEEDPNKPGWASEEQMITHGQGLKEWYETATFAQRHQYEKKANYIMGVNDYTPMYPNQSWYEGFGKGAGGWFVVDNDAASDWVAKYLAHYFAQSADDIGEQLPVYWECYNEPDMNFMNQSFGMIVSGLEKNWEYHKMVAEEVRKKLGGKAPKIGGMTWGQLDLFKPDGVPSRVDGQAQWYAYSSEEACARYDNMLSGVGSGVENPGVGYDVWPKAWDNKSKDWWQWDYMYQGFIDFCGEDMDFYGVHMYDWPQTDANNDKANTRSGGHVEAMLDMFEWYDNQLFGEKKDIVMSEFGAVNKQVVDEILDGRRDWLFIKPFNQMMMQFLERPSHVVYSMPFAPTKATWGAYFSGNNVIRYDGATLMEPQGDWTGNSATWEMNEPTGGWAWSGIIHFFELWKDVEGTRIDTKSSDPDVQVDAYVDGNKVYLILNNCIDEDKSLNLNTFSANENTIQNVEFRHIFRGDDDFTKYTVTEMTSAPEQVSLKPNSTIVLAYTYASDVTIDQESKETKYMCEPLTDDLNDRGTQLCHTPSQTSITATVKGVQKPSKREAIIRIGGFFPNPLDAQVGMKVKKFKVNGNDVVVESDNFITNPRGYATGNYKGAWFGVLELECPIEYLQDGDNTVYFERWQGVEFTTIMIQVFDMTTEPGRGASSSESLSSVAFNSAPTSLKEGESIGLAIDFTPSETNDKALTWSSSAPNVISVDENGVVTALASSGSAIITAKSSNSSSIAATTTITIQEVTPATITGIEIVQGDSIAVNQYILTQLNVNPIPSTAKDYEIEWTTSTSRYVTVYDNGKVQGISLNKKATITATVVGTDITDEITVFVDIDTKVEDAGETNASSVKLYPNPADNQITVEGIEQGAELEIIDLFGLILKSKEAEGDEATLDLSQLAEGVYILRVTLDGQSDQVTFIKK